MSLKEYKLLNHNAFFQAVDAIACDPMNDNGSDYYGYIAQYTAPFELITQAMTVTSPKITDLGCGYCENLLYLGSFFDGSVLSGCELNADYYADMVTLLSDNSSVDVAITNVDYSTYDISDKDIIYSFHPMMTVEKYLEFNAYVFANMKVGAYWLETLKTCTADRELTVLDHKPDSVEILYNQDDIVLMRKLPL